MWERAKKSNLGGSRRRRRSWIYKTGSLEKRIRRTRERGGAQKCHISTHSRLAKMECGTSKKLLWKCYSSEMRLFSGEQTTLFFTFVICDLLICAFSSRGGARILEPILYFREIEVWCFLKLLTTFPFVRLSHRALTAKNGVWNRTYIKIHRISGKPRCGWHLLTLSFCTFLQRME